MSEVLRLEYDASGPSIRITVDEVNGNGVTVVGGAGVPPVYMTLSDVAAANAQLATDLASVMTRLEPIARAQAAAVTPASLTAMAAQLTAQKQALDQQQAAITAASITAAKVSVP